jgi:1,2-phenylacetyl-CoA epoxidase PaaB subunit
MTMLSPDHGARRGRPAVRGVREEAKPSLRTAWAVLARRKYEEPLYQVGTVTADDPSMAALFAQSIYDEHPWIEMVVVPRSAMRTVIAP